jgi:hypothetical protein
LMIDAYVAVDFEAEMQKAKSDANMEAFYTMPDGQIVTFSDQVCERRERKGERERERES